MSAHDSEVNGLSWTDGQLDYAKLTETISESVSRYAHLYAYGTAKTKFLTTLLGQPVRNLEDFQCPPPHGLKAQFICSMPCHKNYLTTVAQHEARIHYSNGSRITFNPETISPFHPNLYAIPPCLIPVYHVCNDFIFLQLYKTAKNTYPPISLQRRQQESSSSSVYVCSNRERRIP